MEVLQIIGSVVLLVVGVGIILYVLFRKSPVKNAEPAEDDAAEDADEEENDDEPGDDIPAGDAPERVEREEKE